VRELLPNTVQVKLDYPQLERERASLDLDAVTPRELFTRYYTERHSAEPEKELLDLFDELLDEVSPA
jgi:hypothetical protein